MRSMLQCHHSGGRLPGVRFARRCTARMSRRRQLPAPVFPYPIQKTTLENGLTVMSVPFDSPGIIAYYTIVRTGSRNEVEKGLSGFAHFFEHMMFRGTDAFSGGEIQRRPQVAGGGFQRLHEPRLHVLPHDHSRDGPGHGRPDRVRPVSEPQVRRAIVPEGSPGRAGRIQQERVVPVPQAQRGDAEHGLHETYVQAYNNRISRRHQGHAQPVRLQQGLLRPLVPARELHDHRGGGREARRSWSRSSSSITDGWKRGKATRRDSRRAAADRAEIGSRDLAVADVAHACSWAITFPPADPKNPDTAALDDPGSVGFRRDRARFTKSWSSKEQKAVQLSGEASPNRDPGLFQILVRVRKPEDLAVVRQRIAAALAEAAKTPIDPAKLTAIKSHLRYEFAGSLDSADAVADALGTAIALTGRPESINELFDAYDRLTPADLKRVAARYFQPEQRDGGHPGNGGQEMTSHFARNGRLPWHASSLRVRSLPHSVSPVEHASVTTGPCPRRQPAQAVLTLLHSPSNPLVAFRVVLHAGSQDDPPGKEGLAALTASMVAEAGSKSRTYSEILAAFYPMAATA